MTTELDAADLRILALLQENARISNAEVARQLGMAPSAIFERIKKLEQKNIVSGYEVRLAPKALGLGLLSFVFVRADEPGGSDEVGRRLAQIPEALEVHHVAGEDCYLVKCRAADTDDLARILKERFSVIPAMRQTRTIIVLSSLKETSQLPLQHLTQDENDAK